jgi:hypothetical protein
VANETGVQTPADDSALARPIGWWLREADARLDAAFDRALDGFPADRRGWQVLSSLARRPSGEADVAEALAAFDPPSVIHEVLAQLTSRGWVTEVDDALRLTEEGTRVHAAIAPLVDQVREQVSGALPRDDYVTLVRLLQRLTAAL